MIKYSFLVCWLATLSGWAQSVSTLMGARAGGLAFASATLQDEWSHFNNAAGLAAIDRVQVAAAMDVRPDLEGANRMAALATLPLGFGVGAVGLFRFGDEVYSEQNISTSYANRIGNTSLGARIAYLQYRAEGVGTKTAIGLSAGGITQLTQQLIIGAWIQNLNRPKLRFHHEEKAPLIMFLSLAFRPGDNYLICTEVEKDVLHPAILKTGMEYTIHKKIFVRTGLAINPTAMFAGLGFKSWRIKIDYSYQGFTQFGSSHQASAVYFITQPKSNQK